MRVPKLSYFNRGLLLKCRYFLCLFVIFSCLIISSCDDSISQPNVVSGPTVALSENAPLAASLKLKTDVPTEVTVNVASDNATNNTVTTSAVTAGADDFSVQSNGFITDHAITLLGFKPDRSYTIQIVLKDEFDNEMVLGKKLSLTTAPLPEGFPPIHVDSKPELMEPGFTLFPVRGAGANATIFGTAFIAVDETGDVVWYRRFDNIGFGDIKRISNGNLLFILNDTTIVEMNMLGDIVREWHSTRNVSPDPASILVKVPYFHHEVFEMENGDFLVLSVELKTLDNYSTSDSDAGAPLGTAVVAGDVAVEFTPSSGAIVNEWHMLDILDPYRIGYDSLGSFWNNNFPEIEVGTKDWAHGNAIIEDPTDNSIIYSSRQQDAVVKISRETGEIKWILGNHDNWDADRFGSSLLTPVGEDFLWQYHQHAPEVTDSGTILLFDNGNYRASPFNTKLPATENFSRAVEYSINEDTKEVSQVWEYGEFVDPVLYAPFIGDADSQPLTGDVLITFGGVTTDADGLPSDNIGASKTSVDIIEVTHETPAEKVFELSIVDPTPDLANGWTTYRAERLPSLYP